MNKNKNLILNGFRGGYLMILIFLCWLGFSFVHGSSIASKVPTEYFANYHIQKDWDRLLEIFVELDAESRMGNLWGQSLYAELHRIMNNIFPHFPQDYNFQVSYKQCQKITKELSAGVTKDKFDSFKENCKTPLSTITNTIKSKYAVKAVATLSPSSGPAPLTVTFDARASKDPSNETIPSKNYFWYYRDIDGTDKPIGYGPVVNYKFAEAGTYLVHLTVRSSNTGIFDGEATVSVNVSPKSANVIVYANGKKMEKNKYVKVGVQEAKRGVVFDASATLPMGGREVLSHRWEITSRDGFKWSREGDGKPGYINIPLPSQGEFIVNLAVVDNEKNVVSERFTLSVSDPVATIQQTPEKGTTSTTYGFSASASYSLTSRLKLYTWEFFDSDGNKLDTLQGKEIKKQFKKPGNYTIKLTVEDEVGMKNIDTINVYVESTPPIPQFSITPTTTWLYPSEFYLNAESSSDADVTNGYDKLTYSWRFSNQNAVKYEAQGASNQAIKVIFNEVGVHKVTLVVADSYGQVSEIEKEISVQSVLRPELIVQPKAAVWKTYVSFLVKSNQKIISYEWDFGDGSTTRVNQNERIKHEYQKVGNYKVSLKAIDEAGNSNVVYDTVYIGEKDSPIIGYSLKNDRGLTMLQNERCEDLSGTMHDAYSIGRQAHFSIDTSSSVNAQGNTSQLRYYFQVQNGEILTTNSFSHKFNALGCQYIDYTLEDTSLGKIVKERIWFKVVNALPQINNLTLSFPQYGNEVGIGFQQGNKTEDIFNSGVDPIIVRVNAENAYDTDGMISYFKRYYYPKNNPNKIIETKLTPGNIPYTYFSVPKQAGEFSFGVKMFDNDDGYQTSEELLGNGPTVFFPASNKQPDIPIVTLKSNTINTEVGVPVVFDVISKILSDRSDFAKERVIQIDFDGDGEIDLTTKNDRVQYVYERPSDPNKPYIPRAYVIYRDYRGEGVGAEIIVKNAIKPALIYSTMGNTVIFKDVSVGELIERELCWDVNECEKGNEKYFERSISAQGNDWKPLSLEKTIFKVQYPKAGVYTVKIKAKDVNGNEAENTLQVKIGEKSETVALFSGVEALFIPSVEQSEKGYLEVTVGRQLKNQLLLYVKTSDGKWSCWIDGDLSQDANFDGVANNDGQYGCNRVVNIAYEPISESIVGRVFYKAEWAEKASYKDFTVLFADFADKFQSEELRKHYQKINTLIASIDDSSSIANADLRNLLITLRNDLGNKNPTRSNVIQIEEFVAKNEVKLTKNQDSILRELLSELSDYATISALWGTPYEVSKQQIFEPLPLILQEKVAQNFERFENPDTLVGKVMNGEVLDAKRVREMALHNIYSDLSQSAVEGTIWGNQIDLQDFQDMILPNLCKIAESYSLNASFCNSDSSVIQKNITQATTEALSSSSSSSWPTWLKVLLWIVGLSTLGFIAVIVAFAIKAKMRENYDEEE